MLNKVMTDFYADTPIKYAFLTLITDGFKAESGHVLAACFQDSLPESLPQLLCIAGGNAAGKEEHTNLPAALHRELAVGQARADELLRAALTDVEFLVTYSLKFHGPFLEFHFPEVKMPPIVDVTGVVKYIDNDARFGTVRVDNIRTFCDVINSHAVRIADRGYGLDSLATRYGYVKSDTGQPWFGRLRQLVHVWNQLILL